MPAWDASLVFDGVNDASQAHGEVGVVLWLGCSGCFTLEFSGKVDKGCDAADVIGLVGGSCWVWSCVLECWDGAEERRPEEGGVVGAGGKV